MKSLGAAKVSIIADAKGMAKGVKDAKRHMSSLGQTLGSAKKMIGGFVVAYAGMKGLGALRDQMQAIDDVAKKSRSLGMATEELIGLRHAASLSGVAMGSLDTALMKMLDGVGDARDGLGEAKESFRQLGIDVKGLEGQSPEAIFYKVADSLDKVKDSAKRVQLAKDIFGRGGVGMLNLTSGGSASAKAAKAEAEKLGMMFSAQDAAQVEAANDAMEKFGQSMASIGKDLAILLAPAVKKVADSFTELVTKLHASGILGREGEARSDVSYAGEILWEGVKIIANAPVDMAKLATGNVKGTQFYQSGSRIGDINSGKAMMEEDAKARREANDKSEREKNQLRQAAIVGNVELAVKETEKLQKEIDKITLGEEEYVRKQMESLDLGKEKQAIIEERFGKMRELKTLQEEQVKAAQKAKEIEVQKQKAIDAQRDAMQEHRDVARSIFEENQTDYERGLLRQKQIMDAYNAGELTGRDAQAALKANKSGVLDSMRSKAQGASTTTQAYGKGSASAYNAIVNALGQKDKQAEIAKNTSLAYAEAQKQSRSLETLVALQDHYETEFMIEDI